MQSSSLTLTYPIHASVRPLWAALYHSYSKMPNHRGKRTLLRMLHHIGVQQEKPFLWPMRNGVMLAISPLEGYAPWSVGWSCFRDGVWEPHIEAALKALIKPGETVMDIGANIGYFSAALAQMVGEQGTVYAFEPLPATFAQLSFCKEYNGFRQLTIFPMALGAESGKVEISYDPSIMGSASIHPSTETNPNLQTSQVTIVRLDDLLKENKVTVPSLIKIDVEGHEMRALQGAQDTIRRGKPHIIFEYNTRAAEAAGWNLQGITSLLKSFADYKFYSLESGSQFKPLEVSTYKTDDRGYVDILASCSSPID